MKYTIYNLETGQIDRVVGCKASDLSLQFDPATQSFLVGEFVDDAYYIESGSPVRLPPRPSVQHQFDYLKKQWIDPRDSAEKWQDVRKIRTLLLEQTDWTQLNDVAQSVKEKWATYRQALRDITQQPDPDAIVWPSKPS